MKVNNMGENINKEAPVSDGLDMLLDKHAKRHMIDWNLSRFKVSHKRLYATFKAVFDELKSKR